MRSPVRWLFFLLFTFAFSKPLYADPKLNASLSANRILPADTTTLTLQIEWPKSEGAYGFAVPDPDLENLSLIRRGESQEFFSHGGQDWMRKSFELELQPLGPGIARVREFSITYVDPATQRQGSFQVSEMRLTVKKATPPLNPLWIFGGGGALLLMVAGGIGFMLARKKRKPPAVAPLSDGEKKALKIKSMIDSGGTSKETFHLIAAELRGFIANHYKTGNPQATEDEIIRILKSQNIPYEEFQRVTALLGKIQEAKYLPEESAARDYKYLQQEILVFIESKKTLESLSRN